MSHVLCDRDPKAFALDTQELCDYETLQHRPQEAQYLICINLLSNFLIALDVSYILNLAEARYKWYSGSLHQAIVVEVLTAKA